MSTMVRFSKYGNNGSQTPNLTPPLFRHRLATATFCESLCYCLSSHVGNSQTFMPVEWVDSGIPLLCTVDCSSQSCVTKSGCTPFVLLCPAIFRVVGCITKSISGGAYCSSVCRLKSLLLSELVVENSNVILRRRCWDIL